MVKTRIRRWASSAITTRPNLILLVSNSTVTLTLQSSSADLQPTNITAYYYPTNSSPTNYVQVTTDFPFLSITNAFTDQRESALVKVTDIDVGILGKWLVTNTTATTKFPSAAGVYNTNKPPIFSTRRTIAPIPTASLRPSGSRMAPSSLPTWSHYIVDVVLPVSSVKLAGSPWRRPIRFTCGATIIARTPLT